jgi:tetratricopeptide (TPR) repeat protein
MQGESPYLSIQEITARMVSAMQSGQYEAALPLLNTLIARDPNDAQLLFSRGLAHHQLSRHAEAIADFERAEAAGLRDADLYLTRAWSHAYLQNAEAALADLQRALDVQPSAMIYKTRAMLYERWAKSEQALADWSAAIALEPTNGELYLRRAVERFRHTTAPDRAQHALADANAALQHGYLRPNAYAFRAELHSALGDLDAALRDLDEAIALDRRSAWAHRQRAQVLLKLGRCDQAITDLTTALKISPDAALYVLRGQAYLMRGQGDDVIKARQDFAQVPEHDPHYPDAALGRGMAYVRLNRPERAEQDFYAFLNWPESAAWQDERKAYAWLILALAQQGKWDDARDQIRMLREFYANRWHDLADSATVAAREGWNPDQQALYAQAWAGAEG